MMGNTLAHLVVTGSRSSDEGDGPPAVECQLLCKGAFAATRAAQDKNETGRDGMRSVQRICSFHTCNITSSSSIITSTISSIAPQLSPVRPPMFFDMYRPINSDTRLPV